LACACSTARRLARHSTRSRPPWWQETQVPSTTSLLRHFAARLEASPKGCVIELADTARALGLGERSGRHAPFARTVGRAIDFEMAQLRDASTLAVRRHLPPLARRHLARLPETLRAQHERLANMPEESGMERLRQRGRQLALSLLQLGEDVDGAERQLMRWRFHPSLARECATWAGHELAARPRPDAPAPPAPHAGAGATSAGVRAAAASA